MTLQKASLIAYMDGTTESYSQEVGDSTWARDGSRHLGTLAIGVSGHPEPEVRRFQRPQKSRDVYTLLRYMVGEKLLQVLPSYPQCSNFICNT